MWRAWRRVAWSTVARSSPIGSSVVAPSATTTSGTSWQSCRKSPTAPWSKVCAAAATPSAASVTVKIVDYLV